MSSPYKLRPDPPVDVEAYLSNAKECAAKLKVVWDDLEVPDEDRAREFKNLSDIALSVWSTAVLDAEEHRQAMIQKIEAAAKDVQRIQGMLGEIDDAEDEGNMDDNEEDAEAENKTINARYNAQMRMLEQWEERKKDRQLEHDDIQEEVDKLRQRLGFPPLRTQGKRGHAKIDISRAHLDAMRQEVDRLGQEKVRREKKVEALLGRLRKVCIEIGEDDHEVAAEAHPSLRFYKETLPGHFFGYSAYKHQGEDKVDGPRPEPDLSDSTFKSLERKIDATYAVKAAREDRLAELNDILENLWSACDIQGDDPDRAVFVRLLNGPARLHAKSLDKCAEEVARLEAQKAELMRDLIGKKVQDLQAICKSTSLPMLDLEPLLGPLDSGSDVTGGQMAEMLSKLVKMVAEVQVIAAKRESIIKQVKELEHAQEEASWLTEYKHDDMRFKGRDANRRLQRSIKAEKLAGRVPGLLAKMQEVLTEWEESEGCPFVYKGLDYKAEVERMVEELARSKDTDKNAAGMRRKSDKENSQQPAHKPSKKPAAPAPVAAAPPPPPARPVTPARPATSPGPMTIMPTAATPRTPPRQRPPGTGEPAMVTPQPRPYNPLQDVANRIMNSSSKSGGRSAGAKRGKDHRADAGAQGEASDKQPATPGSYRRSVQSEALSSLKMTKPGLAEVPAPTAEPTIALLSPVPGHSRGAVSRYAKVLPGLSADEDALGLSSPLEATGPTDCDAVSASGDGARELEACS